MRGKRHIVEGRPSLHTALYRATLPSTVEDRVPGSDKPMATDLPPANIPNPDEAHPANPTHLDFGYNLALEIAEGFGGLGLY